MGIMMLVVEFLDGKGVSEPSSITQFELLKVLNGFCRGVQGMMS